MSNAVALSENTKDGGDHGVAAKSDHMTGQENGRDRLQDLLLYQLPVILRRHWTGWRIAEMLVDGEYDDEYEDRHDGRTLDVDEGKEKEWRLRRRKKISSKFLELYPHPGIIPSPAPPPSASSSKSVREPNMDSSGKSNYDGKEHESELDLPEDIDPNFFAPPPTPSQSQTLPRMQDPFGAGQTTSTSASPPLVSESTPHIYLSPTYSPSLISPLLNAHLPPVQLQTPIIQELVKEILGGAVLGGVVRKFAGGSCEGNGGWMIWKIGLILLGDGKERVGAKEEGSKGEKGMGTGLNAESVRNYVKYSILFLLGIGNRLTGMGRLWNRVRDDWGLASMADKGAQETVNDSNEKTNPPNEKQESSISANHDPPPPILLPYVHLLSTLLRIDQQEPDATGYSRATEGKMFQTRRAVWRMLEMGVGLSGSWADRRVTSLAYCVIQLTTSIRSRSIQSHTVLHFHSTLHCKDNDIHPYSFIKHVVSRREDRTCRTRSER